MTKGKQRKALETHAVVVRNCKTLHMHLQGILLVKETTLLKEKKMLKTLTRSGWSTWNFKYNQRLVLWISFAKMCEGYTMQANVLAFFFYKYRPTG